MVWVPGHMAIDVNEIADDLARQDSSHSLTGYEPAFGVSVEVAGGCVCVCVCQGLDN